MRIGIILRFPVTDKIRLKILICLIAWVIIPSLSFSQEQDLYNPENSKRYAEYLFSSQQHALAAEEFERLVYFNGENIWFKYYLIKSYRLSGDLNSGIHRVYSFYGNSLDTMPQILALEFVKLQLLTDSVPAAETFINRNVNLSSEEKDIYKSFSLLLSGEYQSASLLAKESSVINPAFPVSVLNLTQKAMEIKRKSPFVAATFSAVIPGTGKFYTGNWADGFFSLLFVAGDAWQAYRGFSEHGVKSVYGWVFAGLSTSFYIGNIFGSVKAARRYNNNKKNAIDYQVFEFIRSDSY